jgi:hypothetical protein
VDGWREPRTIEKMRLSAVCLVLATAGTMSACAAISGLDSYGQGNDSIATGLSVDASNDVFVAPADDASTEPSSGDDTSTSPSEAGTVVPVEAGVDKDDAAPPCGPMTCQQCCSNGACIGGGSVDSCGIGGDLCQDCTNKGGACTNGACTTKVADAAAPPACNKDKCGGCAPVWEAACCKSDGTCGCAMSFGSGPCQ